MNRLFVGNIPYSKSESALSEWFESQGFRTRSVEIIQDYTTSRSRGFGFVELEEEARAEHAIRSLNGKEFAGRILTIDRAVPFRSGRELSADADRTPRKAA